MAQEKLEAWFSEQVEHVLFIGFDTWLVKGVYAGELSGKGAGDFKEENESTKRFGRLVGSSDFEDWDTARAMRSDCSFEGFLVKVGKGFAFEVGETIEVRGEFWDGKGGGRGAKINVRNRHALESMPRHLRSLKGLYYRQRNI